MQSSDVQTKAKELGLVYQPPELRQEAELTQWTGPGPMTTIQDESLEEGSSEHSKKIAKPRTVSDSSKSARRNLPRDFHLVLWSLDPDQSTE